MLYRRMPIEVESPEETGYNNIRFNLAESSVKDIAFKELGLDLSDLVLAYGEHRGKSELRSLIAQDGCVGGGKHEKTSLNADHVLLCPSAATALFIVSTTLLSPSDHLIVLRPNYATNLETPRAIGCKITFIDLRIEDGFALDAERIKAAMTPQTRLISVTSPHNPTGIILDEKTLSELRKISAENNCYLLVDETYRDLNFQSPLRPYQAAYDEHVISVCSFSKAFGAPGIRIGWLVCQEEGLMHRFLAAKEQIVIANSVVDEAIGHHLFLQKAERLAPTHTHIRENFALFKRWFDQQNWMEWTPPQAGVVCFPRIKAEHKVNTDLFYQTLYQEHQAIVGPGHWFEQPGTYMRIGFGFPDKAELLGGLAAIGSVLSLHLRQ